MIRHTVLFAFKGLPGEAEKAAHCSRLAESLLALKEPLASLILHIEAGQNCNPQEGFDFALVVDVKNLDSLRQYAQHPLHQAIVKEMIAPHLAQRACVDYVTCE